jgi:hypothetical protein
VVNAVIECLVLTRDWRIKANTQKNSLRVLVI